MATTVSHSNTVAFPIEKVGTRRQRSIPVDEQANLKLHLGNMLQTSLELGQILALFFQEVKRQLNVASLQYLHHSLPEQIELGNPLRHSAHYRLVTGHNMLGELTTTRRRAFAEDELQLLETLIGCLICPLRNALLYREALQSALKDPLTGAGNRLALETTIEREILLSHRHGRPLSVLIIDVDHFKSINDRYGHAAGDCVLKNVSAELRRCSRESDSAYHSYRFGGEEFVMLLDQTDADGAEIVAERIRASIEEMTTVVDNELIKATASIGIASLEQYDKLASLLKRADQALYAAKRAGRNRAVAATSEATQA